MSSFYDLSKTPRNILNQAIVRAIVSENNGSLFDPSDLSTLYQNAAGTTPVTAVEQPVGLWLDKSQGLMLGPELVPQDYLTNPAAWSIVNGTAQAVAGRIIFTANGAGQLAVRILTPVVLNKIVRTSLSISSFDSVLGSLYDYTSGVNVKAINSLPTSNITSNSKTSNSAELIAFLSGGTPAAGASFSIDNLTIKEIYGNHATQSITASRPTLSARYNKLLNSATISTQSVTTVAAQYTLSFTGTGSITLSGTATGTLAGTGANTRVSLSVTPTAGTLTLTVTGSVTLAMLAFGTLTTYQAIITATSYDTSGWPKYLKFDGIDDYLNLPYMGLYANGSASVVAAMYLFINVVNGRLISEDNSTLANPTYSLLIQNRDSTTSTDVYMRNDAGIIKSLQDTSSPLDGIYHIQSVTDTGNGLYMYQDSKAKALSTYTRSGTVSIDRTSIGASHAATDSEFIKANINGLIITKSALSDTDRRRCEQFLSSRLSTLGVTLS